MPYTKPTVAQFTARFPIFADRDPAQVQALLDEASGRVDESWIENDYQPAIMYLTAHLLATDASQEGEVVSGGGEQGAIASESFAGMSVSYASPASNSLNGSAQFGATVYGQRFLALAKASKPGVVIVS